MSTDAFDPDEPVVVAEAPTEAEAALIAGVLKERGIQFTINNRRSTALGLDNSASVEVNVRRADLQVATAALTEALRDQGTVTDAELEQASIAEGDEDAAKEQGS